MRKASEMYELSYKSHLKHCDDDLFHMEMMINEAAKNGRYNICWPGVLRKEVRETLISLGYSIPIELSSGIKISWKYPFEDDE